MNVIILLVTFGSILLGFNWIMGNKNDHIVIDFDERYRDYKKHVRAIHSELLQQGRVVSYKGDRKFIIDGRPYIFVEKNVSMGGAPLQRTILKPNKDLR